MQNLLICVGKLYVAVIILYILVDNLYVLCEEKSSHRFYMYRKTSQTLTKAVLRITSFLRIWEVYTYNFFPISLWMSCDLGGLADSKQTKEGNHNFVWKSSLFASLSKWGQRKVHLAFQPERVEKPCDCNFSTEILLILLLSHKSCLPFSPHHPGLPAIKVDRKQVPRELGRRVPPPFLGSEGATCKWYNMSFWKTSSSNWKCICVFQYQSVDQFSVYTYPLFLILLEAV